MALSMHVQTVAQHMLLRDSHMISREGAYALTRGSLGHVQANKGVVTAPDGCCSWSGSLLLLPDAMIPSSVRFE